MSNAFAVSVERVNSDMLCYRFPSVQSTFSFQSQCWEEYLGCCPNSRPGALCSQECLRLAELSSLLGSRGCGCCLSSPGTGEDRAWHGRYNHLPRPCGEEGPSPGWGQFPGSLGRWMSVSATEGQAPRSAAGRGLSRRHSTSTPWRRWTCFSGASSLRTRAWTRCASSCR